MKKQREAKKPLFRARRSSTKVADIIGLTAAQKNIDENEGGLSIAEKLSSKQLIDLES